MKKRTSNSFKNSYLFEPKDIEELFDLLKKYFDTCSFESFSEDKSSIEYDSKDQLLNSDNYKQNRIVRLEIYSKTVLKYEIVKDCRIIFIRNRNYLDNSIEYRYSFSNKNDEILFSKEFCEFISKKKTNSFRLFLQPLCHTFLSIALFIFSYVACIDIKNLGDLVFGVLIIPLNILLAMFFKKNYLGCVFLWGEECKAHNFRVNAWKFVFWSVIGTIILGIISGKLTEII